MANTSKKQETIINNKLGLEKRELINFSVKAQDLILRAAADGIVGGGGSLGSPSGGYRTTDDLVLSQQQQNMILNSLSLGANNLTTNISQEDASRILGQTNKSIVLGGGIGNDLLLPSVKSVRRGQASPFKGQGNNVFFDMPMMLATQKMMRQTVRQAPEMIQSDKPQQKHQVETARHNHSADRNNSVKMNPKVLETWINETLQDAEHLDIPGVILKPEHKNPISRYGIDRLALTNAGIPNDMVDRIFRALFVYSVGFYELIKKCLQHTERKYSIITSIWKVFSILLEYCCKTDYRMLISEISKEHKEEMDRMEREFQQKFNEQAQNEMQLKKNIETLQRFSDDLEKEKNSERQMRLKLEEEYMQNTKNHEEEVQLRLKFESKLNNMHSVHRDLETKYKRALSELAGLQTINEQLYSKNNAQAEEITHLKTQKAELDSKLSYNDEKLAGLQREIGIKVRQVQDLEQKFTTAQDELDMTKYKLQEMNKDLTELKLKIDVYESQVTGLRNEKQHLASELTQTKDLQKVYEKKCGTLITEINKLNIEFQESKREIIGFGEIQKEREERIEKLKFELRELKVNFEELDLKHGTLTIQHEKVREQYDTCKRDLDDAIEKLHLTNKVRHETELRLTEESERCRSLQDVIRDKDDQLHKRALEIEDLDRRVIDLERTNENLEVKKGAIERQFEITKKQQSEKIQSLTDVLQSEKETRDMWIERYEKEQKEHTQTNAALLQAKSQLKDQVLTTKNVEIKLQTTSKANEVLTEQNQRLQDQLNEALANQENLERDVNTQKEIMKQMEANRKEYISKLKNELLTVESRFTHKVDQAEMVCQDFLSRAAENFRTMHHEQKLREDIQGKLDYTTKKLHEKVEELQKANDTQNQTLMENEDFTSLIAYRFDPQIESLSAQNQTLLKQKDSLERGIEDLKHEIQEKKKLEQHLAEMENEEKLLKTELHMMKKQNEKLQTQIEAMEAAQTGNATKILAELQSKQAAEQETLKKNPTNDSLKQPSQQKSEGRKSVDKSANNETKGSQRSIVPGTPKVKVATAETSMQTDLLMKDLDKPSPQMMMPQQQYNPQMMGQYQQTSPNQTMMHNQFQQANPSMMHQMQQTSNNPSMMSNMQQTSPYPSMMQMQQRPPYPQQQRMSPQISSGQQLQPRMGQPMMQRPNMNMMQRPMMPQQQMMQQQMPHQMQQQLPQQMQQQLPQQMQQQMPQQINQQVPQQMQQMSQSAMMQRGTPSPLGEQQMPPPQINNFDQQTFAQQPGIEGHNLTNDMDGGNQVPYSADFQQETPYLLQEQYAEQMGYNPMDDQKQIQMMYGDPNQQIMMSPMGGTMPGTIGSVSQMGEPSGQHYNDTTMLASTLLSPMNNTLSSMQPLSPGNAGGQFQFPQNNNLYMQPSQQYAQDPNQMMYQDTNYPNQDPYMMQQQYPGQQMMQMQQYDPNTQGGFYDPTQAPIMEQMAEYEEDRQQPHLEQNSIEQRSQHSQGSQQQQMLPSMRQSSQRSNVNPSNGQRTPGNRVPIDYKNMNTVMQTQNSLHSAASGVSNKSLALKNQGSNLGGGMLPNINQLDRLSSHHSNKGGMMLEPTSSHSQRDHFNMTGSVGDQHQTLPPITNTRMKVDISSNSNYNNRANLASGNGNPSVHTPISQMSGYSQGAPLASQQQVNNSRMMQPQLSNVQVQSPTYQGNQGPSVGGGQMQGSGGQQQHHPASGPMQSDRKVTGKSSIRTLIKAAATRD